MNLQAIAAGRVSYSISVIRQNRLLVQSIQASLNKMGFPAGRVDGSWDQDTDAAYRMFARQYGFKQDEVSPRAANFIISAVGQVLPTPTPTPKVTPTPVPTPTPIPTPVPGDSRIFEEGLRFSLRWEGGWVNNPADVGGETNKGITTRTYADYRRRKGLSQQSVKFITDAEVREVYRDMYWRPAQCDLKVRPLAIVHFDTAINFGVGGSTMFLQEVLGLPVDGVYGPMTRAALARANNATTARHYCQARIDYRYKRVTQDPSQRVFLAGWLNRDNDLLGYVSALS